MSLTESTYWVVGASFALYIIIAIRARAGSTRTASEPRGLYS